MLDEKSVPRSDFASIPASIPAGVFLQESTCWMNFPLLPAAESLASLPLSRWHLEEAARSWERFAPLLACLFPEQTTGRIDSDFTELPREMQAQYTGRPYDTVWVKCDHALPVTGSIKARGGVYEVLCYAESIALEAGMLTREQPYSVMALDEGRKFFAEFTVVVGSTGNLGYSVGVIARALGMNAEIHMSKDAQVWKKNRLRNIGAIVVEHAGDYSSAVSEARKSVQGREKCHFVDDENSATLFLGYAAAAFDLQAQLKSAQLEPSIDRPLYVYLPCGVGGAPAGITFGLKVIFGDAVRCVFAEPTAAPCMLVQLAAGLGRSVSVYDVGLDNRTIADGLAVSTASKLAAGYASALIDAIVTVPDHAMLEHVRELWRHNRLRLEPSAASGFVALTSYSKLMMRPAEKGAIHVVWTTGGSMLPDSEFDALLAEV